MHSTPSLTPPPAATPTLQPLQVLLEDADLAELASAGMSQDDMDANSAGSSAGSSTANAPSGGSRQQQAARPGSQPPPPPRRSSATDPATSPQQPPPPPPRAAAPPALQSPPQQLQVPQQQQASVRVATIDNFQGEEADMVIISLVRSNAAGAIGFLREPERINVLLSRARDGMIIMGNAACLRSASHPEGRRHWQHLLDQQLAPGGHIFAGLPAQCQQHGQAILPLMDSPAAFLQRAPDGGCCLPCGSKLPCGHACPLRCHGYDPGHEQVVCQEQVYEFCGQGHVTVRKCSDRARECPTCVAIREKQQQTKRELEQLVGGKGWAACLCLLRYAVLTHAVPLRLMLPVGCQSAAGDGV